MPDQYGREQGGQKEMKFETIDKRISSLEEAGSGGCPRCQALAAMTPQEIDLNLADIKTGQCCEDLPESSPSCKKCHKYDGMTEAELDAEFARLRAILEKADSY
jgi:hypothetical protein